MSSEAKEILRKISLFESLGDQALDAVAQRTVIKNHPKNATLFREGMAARGLYIVVEGGVTVYRAGADGREQVLLVEQPGHSVAELPLLDGAPYPASARTSEPSRILFLPRDSFQWLYQHNPEIADATIRELARRLRKVVHLVDKLSLKDVPARVATKLLEVATAVDALHEGGEFALDATQEELAGELGTTRESVSRALSALRKNGIIALEGSRVRILALASLRHAAGVPLAAVTGSVYERSVPRQP